MANLHAKNYQQMKGVELIAACDINEKRAREFALKYNIPYATTDAASVLSDNRCDGVSVTASDIAHGPLSLQAVRAGKHVLCEKPLALDYSEAARMARAATQHDVIHMVNFSYRHSSALYRAKSLVSSGALGSIRHVEASYLQSWLCANAWGDWSKTPAFLWRASIRHGSKGVLGDIGVHLIDFTTFPIGSVKRLQCHLKTFPKTAGKRKGDYVFDANDSALVQLEFTNGAIASLTTTRWATGHINSITLSIHGDRGAIRIDLDRSYTDLHICRGKDRHTTKWKRIRCAPVKSNYERFISNIRKQENGEPDFTRGAEVQKILDRCFTSNARGSWVRI